MLDQREFDQGLQLAQVHDFGVLVRLPLALGVLAGRLTHVTGPDERRQRFDPFLSEIESRLPTGMSIPEAALRFLLSSPAISTVPPTPAARGPGSSAEAIVAVVESNDPALLSLCDRCRRRRAARRTGSYWRYRPNRQAMATRQTTRRVSQDTYDLHDVFGRVCPSLKALGTRRPPRKRFRTDARKADPVIEATYIDITTADVSAFISSEVARRGLACPRTGPQRPVRRRGVESPEAAV